MTFFFLCIIILFYYFHLSLHSCNRWYYLALGANLVLRLMWTFTISPTFAQKLFGSYNLALTMLASVEIVRRGIWNVFRLEAEHLSNIGKFRAVRDMPLPLPNAKEYHLGAFNYV
jgi:hypothetical protein